ncbi:hypothetical protein Q4E93_19380 [Flavitalea sp. BT771]|uniref:hypothetical protein n=1 Tax=Flavitalea sp. BT771 TaxID=3063329 RepID=UPI0026E2FE98|nr:hypothetical protein [Flavitalea sp. BT771]MDO6432778.1 hypothetical protein [Flavitalea sp. BT771]MDV6221946.1 hypothetical protein [Flavitalea sp. BT771]
MRNFTRLLLLSCLLFSCSKHNDGPGGSSGPSPAPPAVPAAPQTTVTVTINDTVMKITSLSYSRYGSGEGGGMTITAANAFQKVMAKTFNWYQRSPWSMMYTMEVSYFTRADSLADWGEDYTRPAPRDDEVRYENFLPLSDSVVRGDFSGTFNGSGGIVKGGGNGIKVKGNFKLVFIK